MKIVAGGEYFFKKSGNKVRAIAPSEPVKGDPEPSWTVERVDGASKGKQMLVYERALVAEIE